MSKALRCNRCKKFFAPEEEKGEMISFRNPTVHNAENLENNTCTVFDPHISRDELMDLCPECSVDFRLFMGC